MNTKAVWGSVLGLSMGAALCNAANAQYSPYPPQYQAATQYPGYVQFYPNNPAPAAPTSWSYNPYTSGLGPCPQRDRGDTPCSERIAPTAGQPNYWVRCAPVAGPGVSADAQCQQLAVRQAFEYANAQQAGIEQQIASQAARQAGMLTLPASAYEPVSVDYTTPSDNRHRRVTVKRLNSYSEPARRQICDTFTRIDVEVDSGVSTTGTARRCKGPDGAWRDA